MEDSSLKMLPALNTPRQIMSTGGKRREESFTSFNSALIEADSQGVILNRRNIIQMTSESLASVYEENLSPASV